MNFFCSVNSDEQPQDIEFTVTTLNCSHSLERQSTVESDNGLQISEAAQRKVSTVGIALGRFASLRKTKGDDHTHSRTHAPTRAQPKVIFLSFPNR